MIEKILVPLDGSELAAAIVPYVAQLAGGLDARVTLFTVVDPDAVDIPARLEARRARVSPSALEAGSQYASGIYERVERSIRKRLQNGVEGLANQGIQAEARVVFGRVAEEIVKVAEDEDYGLIAMSTHARRVLARGILGSVTDRVVHSSLVPVLTITPAEARKYWQQGMNIAAVVTPLDGSPLSESALPYAEELAQKLSLRLIIARVVDIGAYSLAAEGYPYISATSLEEELEEEANSYLNVTAEKLRARGLDVTPRLLRGSPAKAIVDLAHEIPQSVVVITTHGRSGFKRWVMGSVAEKVVRFSGHPVLIVPPYQK
jgi:nucleotide-binding universal stress UspA family protein